MHKRLVSDRYPYVPLYLDVKNKGNTGLQLKVEALLDTGFTGDVVIPEKYLADLRIIPDAYATFRLADANSSMAPVYQGSVSFPEFEDELHVPFYVTIVAMGDDVLVGRGLMDRFLVTLDHGRRLTVEP